jgi:hypothetical protein
MAIVMPSKRTAADEVAPASVPGLTETA